MWCVVFVDGAVECPEDSSPFSSSPFDPDPYNVVPLHLSSAASLPPHLPQVTYAVLFLPPSVLTNPFLPALLRIYSFSLMLWSLRWLKVCVGVPEFCYG